MSVWRLEHRLVGWRALAFPLLTGLTMVLVAVLTSLSGGAKNQTAILTAGLELGIPVAAAALIANLVGSDPTRELQLSLPASYRTTVARRAALGIGWPILTCVGASVALTAAGRWMAPATGLGGQLTWLAPLAFLSALACVLTVTMRSHVAAVAVLGTLAVAEATVHDLFTSHSWLHPIYLLASTTVTAHGYWWANRVWLLSLSGVMLFCTWTALARPERLLEDDS